MKLWLRTSNWYYKLGINMEYPFKISITFCHEGWRTIHSRTFLLQFFISCCKEKLDLSNTYSYLWVFLWFFQITYRIFDWIYQISFFQCSLSVRINTIWYEKKRNDTKSDGSYFFIEFSFFELPHKCLSTLFK